MFLHPEVHMLWDDNYVICRKRMLNRWAFRASSSCIIPYTSPSCAHGDTKRHTNSKIHTHRDRHTPFHSVHSPTHKLHPCYHPPASPVHPVSQHRLPSSSSSLHSYSVWRNVVASDTIIGIVILQTFMVDCV